MLADTCLGSSTRGRYSWKLCLGLFEDLGDGRQLSIKVDPSDDGNMYRKEFWRLGVVQCLGLESPYA